MCAFRMYDFVTNSTSTPSCILLGNEIKKMMIVSLDWKTSTKSFYPYVTPFKLYHDYGKYKPYKSSLLGTSLIT